MNKTATLSLFTASNELEGDWPWHRYQIVVVTACLAASNLGILSVDAPAYDLVLKFLLPLAIPLLLFRADLRRVVSSTGVLLLPFLLGSVATTIGTVVAYLLVPMRSLGPDSWKIATALMGRHIGGAVNYVAISDALGVQPSVLAAGLAADNVICALYFSALFALASKVPPEPSASVDGIVNLHLHFNGFCIIFLCASVHQRVHLTDYFFLSNDAMNLSGSGDKLPVLQMATSLAVSFAICKAATILTGYFGIQGGTLPLVTAIVVISATIFPKPFASLASSGEPMDVILIQVFFGVIGASGSIRSVMNTAPSIFLFYFVQIIVHLSLILGLGRLFRFDLKSCPGFIIFLAPPLSQSRVIYMILKRTSKIKVCFGSRKYQRIGYTDGDMVRDIDFRKSTSGFLIMFLWGVDCGSRTYKSVALSTRKENFVVTSEACK
ncbi:unnamed protein product [Vicia faba]|uniref:Uncharacterized protein n=1 Tax=Vicia faba TaxID=3906 RepID=A0AAV0ZNB5_VICFA|nr:unnamed protein product [Vicia faba]